MDEHDDDLTSEVTEDAEAEETESFPLTADEFEDEPEGEKESPSITEDESEL